MRWFAALIVLTLAASAAAQERARPPAGRDSVDVDRLPLSLSRIQRELQHQQDLEERDGLNLRYTIRIYGSAPRLELFSEDESLVNGPVPWGAPTHQEMIDQVTPREFRAPFADFSSLIRWLSERNKKK